jgi:hypothetical protein
VKKCGKCRHDLDEERFQKATRSKDGLQPWCRECRAAHKKVKDPQMTITRTRDGKVQIYERGPNHGLSKTPLYKVWKGMRTRCNDSSAQNYRFYGGRGITVCVEWEKFLPFNAWATTHGYEEGMQLDRIDNEQGYCPANCKWVTRLHNLQNRRAYLPEDLEQRLVAEARLRDIPVYALIREAISAYLL